MLEPTGKFKHSNTWVKNVQGENPTPYPELDQRRILFLKTPYEVKHLVNNVVKVSHL